MSDVISIVIIRDLQSACNNVNMPHTTLQYFNNKQRKDNVEMPATATNKHLDFSLNLIRVMF